MRLGQFYSKVHFLFVCVKPTAFMFFSYGFQTIDALSHAFLPGCFRSHSALARPGHGSTPFTGDAGVSLLAEQVLAAKKIHRIKIIGQMTYEMTYEKS